MAVDDDKLRAALEMLHKGELKDVAFDRGVAHGATRRDEYIEELIEDDWTVSEFEELKREIERLEEEDRWKGHYVMDILEVSQIGDSSEKDTIKMKINQQEVEFTDNKRGIQTPGFEITSESETEIQGTYWTKTDDYILNPLGNLRETSTLYGTGFKIDLDERRIYIQSSLYSKAQHVRRIFDESGVHVEAVGFQDLTNDEANKRMEEFVEDLESRLDELDDQTSMGEFQ